MFIIYLIMFTPCNNVLWFQFFFVISYTCTLTFYSSLSYFIFPSPCPNPFSVNIMSGSGRWEEPSFTGMWTTYQWLLHWREWLALLQSPLTAHSSSVRSPSWVTKWWQDPSFASNQGWIHELNSLTSPEDTSHHCSLNSDLCDLLLPPLRCSL